MESTGFRLKVFVTVFAAVMLLGTVTFAWLENLSFLDALYFSVVTVATVGYGDIHPTSAFGKLLVMVLIVMGVGTFLEVIAGVTQVMLQRRDRELRAEKLNMIVGLFFSELGNPLLKLIAQADRNLGRLGKELNVSEKWSREDFSRKGSLLARHEGQIEMDQAGLERVKALLERKGDLLLRLLENPSLLEQGSFTELLRAVFHLRDELLHRERLSDMPRADRIHLTGDLMRIYRSLSTQWLGYMEYLKHHYPYIFSLAMRTNPFDPNANPVVREAPEK